MPGKVNPVLMEAVIQTGIKVIANDLIITEAANRGSLQINEFLPLLADAFMESLDILIRINRKLAEEILRISADESRCRGIFDRSTMIVTAFLPEIGYDRAREILSDFRESGETNVKEFLEKQLGSDLVNRILSPYQLTALGFKKNGTDTKRK
jgi:aspartate ammonia-lyase